MDQIVQFLSAWWATIIGFCIIMYVVLDGFDLGVGILFLFCRKREERDVMMSTILPLWDGNQTWLVLGIASMYGAFPHAFSLIIPSLYLPLIIMVLALLFRGITFEFRLKDTQHTNFWDAMFFIGSVIVTIIQGFVLGIFVQGFTLINDVQLGYALFTPFNFTCAIALLFGYALLGATWVVSKTEGVLQEKMYRYSFVSLCAIAFFLFVVSVWSPFLDPAIGKIWFDPNLMYQLAFLPLLSICLIIACAYSIMKHYENVLYWLCVGVFLCSYAGFGISTWPYIIPRIMTIQDAAAPPYSLLFMLVGAAFLLPLLVAYTFYSYYIFRGKVTKIIGYE